MPYQIDLFALTMMPVMAFIIGACIMNVVELLNKSPLVTRFPDGQ